MRTAVLPLLVLPACTAPPPPPAPGAPRPVVELESWRVEVGGRQLGRVVAREIQDPRGAIRYYHVENAAHQWLGYLDDAGRLYRYEPFRPEERFLGVYSMAEGLAVLFEAAGGRLAVVPEGDSAAAVREAAMRIGAR